MGKSCRFQAHLKNLFAQGQQGVNGLGGVCDPLLVSSLLQPASEPVELDLAEASDPFHDPPNQPVPIITHVRRVPLHRFA